MKTLNILAGVRIALIFGMLIFMLAINPESIKDVSLCIGYILTGRVCPGCGGTRAFVNMLHFNFADAFYFNPATALFIYPAFMLLYINDIYAFIYRLVTKKKKLSLIEYYLSGEFITGGI